MMKMVKTIEADQQQVEAVDLSNVPDGDYLGRYGDFLVAVNLKTTVKNHQITGITIIDQKCGPGYEGRETVERIIKAQSPKVDAVTGATSSSRSIMVAVYHSLKKATK